MKLRKALTNQDFKKLNGEVRDCPQHPAIILLDDVNQEIIEIVKSNPFWYSISNYPISHY